MPRARLLLIALTLVLAAGCKRNAPHEAPGASEQKPPPPPATPHSAPLPPPPPTMSVPYAAIDLPPEPVGPPCSSPPSDDRVATSPDRMTKVFVHVDPTRQDQTAFGPADHEDLCVERAGRKPAVLLRGRSALAGAGVEETLSGFRDFVFSPDGQTLYFTSEAWATSEAAHAVDLRTGRQRFITDGKVIRPIESGPNRGLLLASHFRIDWQDVKGETVSMGRKSMTTIMTPQGKTVKRWIGEQEPDAAWTGETLSAR